MVVAGLGPGGPAAIRLVVAAGAGSVIACDSKGAVHIGRVADQQYKRVELFDTVAPRLEGFGEPTRFQF